MRPFLLAAAVFLAAGCSSPHWVGDRVEAVDGYWIMDTRPCGGPGCGAVQRAALVAVGDPDGTSVETAWEASWTTAYVDGRGYTILQTISPPIGIDFHVVVLDLKDGSRRVVPISCSFDSGDPDANHWDDCGPDGMEHRYNLVGNEPWTQPQPNSL